MQIITLSKLSHQQERAELRRMLEERDALLAAQEAELAPLNARRTEGLLIMREKLNAARAEWEALAEAIDAEAAPIEERHGAIIEAKDDAILAAVSRPVEGDVGETTHDWRLTDDGEFLRCALTGQPIHDEDDVITDEDTGDVILRDVLPWPKTSDTDIDAD
jgi:hypothetical protein